MCPNPTADREGAGFTVRSPGKFRHRLPKGGKRGKRRGAGPAPTLGRGGPKSPRGSVPLCHRAQGEHTPQQHLPPCPHLGREATDHPCPPHPGTSSEPGAGAWLHTTGRGARQPHSQLVQHPLHFLIDTHGRGLILLLLVRLPGGIAL